jgi:predicted glycoside hydrolase/deacetylase ChbG (UPF0249 family)
VNADDFGISPGVNLAIVEAHRLGICTSASLMANQPWASQAVELRGANPGLGLGLHLTLTAGRPISPAERVPSLVGAAGQFHPLPAFLARAALGALRPDELRRELGAQVERALALGARPGHLDGHHHVHVVPPVRVEALRVALEYGIRAVRVPCEPPRGRAPRDLARALVVSARAGWLRRAVDQLGLYTTDHFRGLGLGYGFGPHRLASELGRLPRGLTELMVHPGYPDAALAAATSYVTGRERELGALTAEATRAALRRFDVELVTWSAAYPPAADHRPAASV